MPEEKMTYADMRFQAFLKEMEEKAEYKAKMEKFREERRIKHVSKEENESTER